MQKRSWKNMSPKVPLTNDLAIKNLKDWMRKRHIPVGCRIEKIRARWINKSLGEVKQLLNLFPAKNNPHQFGGVNKMVETLDAV